MQTAADGEVRPRVIVVAHSLVATDGGMETVHVRLITEMLDRVRVVAVTSRLDPSLVGRVEFIRVRVPATPAPLRFAAFFVVASLLLHRLRRGGDIIHTCGAIVANRISVASIHTLSAAIVDARQGRLAPPGLPLLRRVNSGLLRFLALRAERYVYRAGRLGLAAAVSAVTASEVERFYPTVPVAVTPNGVDPGRFHPDPEVGAAVRRELEIPTEAVVTLFVGGDFERKGLGLAIEALRLAPSVTLVAAGPGDVEGARRRAIGAGVADRARILGTRRDVERLDQAADIFLCASDYEADSLALLEAAATGLALVSTRVGSAEELLGDGVNAAGLLVDRTVPAIAAALEELAADPGLRRRLGAEALERSKLRRWSVATDQMLSLFDQLR